MILELMTLHSILSLCSFFFFQSSADHLDLHVLTHSFPSRRSSDLAQVFYLQDGLATCHGAHRNVLRGSKASRTASPMKISRLSMIARMADRKSTRLNSSH